LPELQEEGSSCAVSQVVQQAASESALRLLARPSRGPSAGDIVGDLLLAGGFFTEAFAPTPRGQSPARLLDDLEILVGDLNGRGYADDPGSHDR
jgi:hypothetical protein